MKLDTRRQVETPEGLALGLRLAGVLPRGCALVLDTIVRGMFYGVLALVFMWFGVLGEGLMVLAIFVTEWFYYVLFEVFFHGMSPGKYWLGLRVLHDDGTPVGWNASLIRNFMRAVDFLPGFYGFGVLCASLSPSFRRLGDWAGGTVVVHDSNKKRLGRRRGRRALEDDTALRSVAPPLVLDREEQGALLAFHQRRSQWNRERAEELANILEPITRATGAEGLERTLGYGMWLGEEA